MHMNAHTDETMILSMRIRAHLSPQKNGSQESDEVPDWRGFERLALLSRARPLDYSRKTPVTVDYMGEKSARHRRAAISLVGSVPPATPACLPTRIHVWFGRVEVAPDQALTL
jgi:hypothetical protein